MKYEAGDDHCTTNDRLVLSKNYTNLYDVEAEGNILPVSKINNLRDLNSNVDVASNWSTSFEFVNVADTLGQALSYAADMAHYAKNANKAE